MNAIQLASATLLVAGAIATAPARAFSPIDISASNAGWRASYSSFEGAAYQYLCPVQTCLSISSTGFADGTFVGGGTVDDFTGRWTASLAFDVPFNPEGVQLDLQMHGVDDIATFSLNGIPLVTQYLQDGPYGATLTLRNGALFNGGTNVLTIDVINAPFHGTEPVGLWFPGDGTAVSFSGAVTAVPEPGSWALMAAGVGWLVSRRLRRDEPGAATSGGWGSGSAAA